MDNQTILAASLTGVIRAVIEEASLSMKERQTLCDIIIDIYRTHDVPQGELMVTKFKNIKHELDIRQSMERVIGLN
jgi:hypothetical protein